MQFLCPTCRGKGRIPDPNCIGRLMMYCNPHTGDSFPHIPCRSCGGDGWVSGFDAAVIEPSIPLRMPWDYQPKIEGEDVPPAAAGMPDDHPESTGE